MSSLFLHSFYYCHFIDCTVCYQCSQWPLGMVINKFLPSFFAIRYMFIFFTAQRIVQVIFRAAVVRQLVAHLNLLCRVISLLSFILYLFN